MTTTKYKRVTGQYDAGKTSFGSWLYYVRRMLDVLEEDVASLNQTENVVQKVIISVLDDHAGTGQVLIYLEIGDGEK